MKVKYNKNKKISGLPNTGLVGTKVGPFLYQQLLQLRQLHPSHQIFFSKESVTRDQNEKIFVRMNKQNHKGRHFSVFKTLITPYLCRNLLKGPSSIGDPIR